MRNIIIRSKPLSYLFICSLFGLFCILEKSEDITKINFDITIVVLDFKVTFTAGLVYTYTTTQLFNLTCTQLDQKY